MRRSRDGFPPPCCADMEGCTELALRARHACVCHERVLSHQGDRDSNELPPDPKAGSAASPGITLRLVSVIPSTPRWTIRPLRAARLPTIPWLASCRVVSARPWCSHLLAASRRSPQRSLAFFAANLRPGCFERRLAALLRLFRPPTPNLLRVRLPLQKKQDTTYE